MPKFFDARPASFTCSDGQGFEDPLVVISAGDGSGSDLKVKIESDGSFSYSGPAFWNLGTATMQFNGRFDGATATGSVHWTASRPTSNGSCSADSGKQSWTAHCVEQCGGGSSGGFTVEANGKPVIGQWALLDIHVKADGASRLAAFVHHKGSRACGTFAEEDAAAAGKGRHGPVEQLGEAQVPAAGLYTFHARYIPDQFGHADRVCAFLTQAPAGEIVLTSGEGTPKIGFALPWTGIWGGSLERTGVQNIGTPNQERTGARGTAPGFFIVGSWGCDHRRSTSTLTGRRWWLKARSFAQALRTMPLKPTAAGAFSYSGPAVPDFSNEYDHPIPRKWASHSMRVAFKGHFVAGHDHDGNGVVGGIVGKLNVKTAGRSCSTNVKVKGRGVVSDLPAATQTRYSGTLTAG